MIPINQPLVSVVLPLLKPSPTSNLCISSLSKQTYKNFEVLLVIRKEFDAFFAGMAKEHPFLRIVHFTGTKSAARNYGAKKSAGEYLLHIDEDMELPPNVLRDCISTTLKQKVSAIVIPELTPKSGNFWTNCRALEKEIYLNDPTVEGARFIKQSIFNRLGGFDESVDMLDEWDLHATLVEHNISIGRINSPIFTHESVTLLGTIQRKYARGRFVSSFKQKHKDHSQLVVPRRLGNYIKNWPKLILHPILFFGLVTLKSIELTSFWAGTFKPVTGSTLKQRNKELFNSEAKSYEAEFYKNTLGARYVDQAEKSIVLSILKNSLKTKTPKILDLGMGPGRWSKAILETFPNSTVTGVDISPNMVKIACKNLNAFGKRFEGKVGDMERLPFKDNSFDAVVNIRALKYALNHEAVLYETNRVLKPNGVLVLEVPNANPVARLLFYIAPVLEKVIKSNFIGYLNRAELFTKKRIISDFTAMGMLVSHVSTEFTVPATIYSKTDNKFALKFLKFFDGVLPKSLFGRSIFIAVFAEKFTLTRKPLVSVVIPTHNRKDELLRLITSVQKSNYSNLELIVVDDASTDGTYETVRKMFPKIRIIKNKKNLLLAASRNIGIEHSKGDLIFLIDDDNIVSTDAITELLNTLRAKTNPPIGVVEPIMYYLKQPKRVWGAGVERNMITSLTKLIGKDQVDMGQFKGLIYSKDAPNAFMIKRGVIQKGGLFDDEHFAIMYDEADFGERIRKLGYTIACNPQAKIWHDIPLPEATEDRSRLFHVHNEVKAYYIARNRILFHRKYSKLWQFMIFILMFNWLFTLYYLNVILFGSKKSFKDKLKIAKSYLKGVLDGLK